MKKTVIIHIGDFFASKEPVIIKTVLGSCVAVGLLDPVKKIGGMNHILLPGRTNLGSYDSSARYGINAMELLINKMINLGAHRQRIIAKVFGGAHVLPAIPKEYGVGAKLVEFVVNFLDTEKIKIVGKDMGGEYSRKIFFHTDTGEVFIKRLGQTLYKRISDEKNGVNPLKKGLNYG